MKNNLRMLALALWGPRLRPWSMFRRAAAVASGVVLAALVTDFFVVPLRQLLGGMKQGLNDDQTTSGGHNSGLRPLAAQSMKYASSSWNQSESPPASSNSLAAWGMVGHGKATL